MSVMPAWWEEGYPAYGEVYPWWPYYPVYMGQPASLGGPAPLVDVQASQHCTAGPLVGW